MSLQKIVAGDYGYEIELEYIDVDTNSAADLSAYTTTQTIQIRAPDGSIGTLSGSFSTDGTDGLVKAVVTDGAIPEKWQNKPCAARIQVTRTGGKLSSEWEEFSPS